MNSILYYTIVLGIVGIISTGFGGLFATIVKIKNNNYLACIYEITAGVMTGIVCFSMLQESYEINGVFSSIIGVIIGIVLVCILDLIISKNKNVKKKQKCSYIVVAAMSLHNIAEGLAIGTSFCISNSIGISLLIAIALHNIPEGMVVGVLNKDLKKMDLKPIITSSIAGAFLGVGGFIGKIIGDISNFGISICLSLASRNDVIYSCM